MNGVGPSLYLAPPVAFTSCHCPLSPAMIIPILLLRNSDSERLSNLSKAIQPAGSRQRFESRGKRSALGSCSLAQRLLQMGGTGNQATNVCSSGLPSASASLTLSAGTYLR